MKYDWRSHPARLPLVASLSSCKGASRSICQAYSLFLITLPLCIIGSLTSINTVTAQQVTSDGTVSTTVTTPDGKNFNINDGTTRQGNLFHSFKEFSVPTGGSANFNNAADVRNIIGRVTGNSVSNIDGLIKTLNPANLFLLNPAGIIFGPNASLNIGGSFLGTTAHSFLFDNGFEFSATNPQAPPLLTINVPIGLGFRDNPANITNQSRTLDTSTNIFGLAVRQGNSLTLVGGNVSLDGGILFAPGGRIELGGLSAPGTIGLNGDGSLSFPVGVQRADVSLTNGAIAYVRSGGGGSIAVNARNLDILGGSRLLAGIEQGLGTVGSQAGDITLNATGSIKVVGSYVFNSVQSQAVGNGGNINITTGSFSLSDGAQLQASTYGLGNAGNVSVRALGSVELAGSNTRIFSTVEAGGVGKSGNIDIKAATFSLKDGAQLRTLVRGASDTQPAGRGDAGNVTVDVTGLVTITGVGDGYPSGIFNYVDTGTTGNGGNITISSNSFSLSDGAQLQASTYGQGNAGNVSVRALGAVELANSAYIYNTVEAGGVGKSGNIDIKAATLSLKNGAQLVTYVAQASANQLAGKGDAGNVTIDVTGPVTIAGVGGGFPSGIFNYVGTGTTGNGGNITISSSSFSLSDGARVEASTYGQGNTGNVTIQAKDAVSFDGVSSNEFRSGVFNTVENGATGDSGAINITAGSLSLTGGAQVNAGTLGQGNAGQVNIDVRDAININGFRNNSYSEIVTAVFPGGKGNGGNVNIKARSLSVSDQARIDPMVYGEGNAGSAFIDTKDFVSLSNGYIYSSVFDNGVGNGGDINIKTGTLSLTDGAYLSVDTANRGNTGRVFVEADAVYISKGASIQSKVYPNAVGNSREINIKTGLLSLTDGGNISASSEGNGSAGNIEVSADSIRLNNQASIKANATREQGNINLRSGDLVLRRGSNITTDATGTATGGNITIDAGVLAALENSDIRANAQDGSGGKITIKTQGLFGLVLRTRSDMDRLRPNDLDPNQLPTSDITAISQNNPDLSGTVNIITPDIDPTRGLFELSEAVIDPAQQIAQNPCIKGFGNSFTITGRGGLPTDPNKILSSDNVRVDLIKPVASTVSSTSTTQKQPSRKPPVKEIIPARGWIYNEKGEVLLVGYDPTKTGSQREQPAPTSNCAAVR